MFGGGFDPAAFQQMMNSPQFAQMRQMLETPEVRQMMEQVASDPSITEELKKMQQSAMSGNMADVLSSLQTNPKVMQFAQQMGQKFLSNNPMLAALQQPQSRDVVQKQMEEMQKDPEFAELMKEMQTAGPSGMAKYWNDPEMIKKFSKYGERIAGVMGQSPGDDAEALAKQLQAANLDEAGAEEEEEEFVCLQDAVQEGNIELLKEVLEAGIPVDDADEEDRTALHFACGYGELECAQELVTRGADINAKDKSENTPLHYASGYGKAESVKFLLKQEGLDKAAKNKEGLTALQVAEVNEFKEIAELLA